MAMAMAMTTLEEEEEEEREAYARYVRRLEDWNEGKGFPLIDPPTDAPKWRGHGLLYFKICGPIPGFGIAQRARNIASCFEIPERDDYCYLSDEDEDEEKEKETVEWLEGLLDELQAYDVESIDVATVLHSYGCLFPFLRDVFSNKHACIRAKAAELITSMVQNHPTSQQLVIEVNGLQLLLHNFTTDPDTTSRTNALGAISSLIRNNKSGITVFLRENGYEALRNALNWGTVYAAGSSTHNDEVVNLIGYLRRESCKFVGDDPEVQEARKGGNSGQLGKNDDKRKQDDSKKRRNYSSLKRRLKPFNKLHLPPFQKKGRSISSSKRMKLH